MVAAGAVYQANPSNYNALLAILQPGDTVVLAGGTYPLLSLSGLNGTPSAWIAITGPASGAPAIIAGSACCNTVEISNSSYLAIQNLTVDSQGIDGVFGISAHNGLGNLTHDILIENNLLIGQNASQQTDGISTKIPTWGWIIRHNTIIGAGTGIYLGNSDGTDPFIAGLIENNLIRNTIGYNMEIKYQLPRPTVAGMPNGPSTTIIRNNVFIKDNQPSPDGDRPNVLLGGFPTSGAGSGDLYQVYGNFFDYNPREALLQVEGRVDIHDNIFVDGQYTAIYLTRTYLPLSLAYVYNNTIYSTNAGIYFGSAATADGVTGNLVFAATPITGPIANLSNNIVDSLANAPLYVTAPSFILGMMDFYPLPGRAQGPALDLSKFAADTASGIDFNGTPKNALLGAIVFRGAYAGQDTNPGWKLQAAIKPPSTGVAAPVVSLSAGRLAFANQNVGSTSASQSVTLDNIGAATLLIGSIVLNGADPGDFAQTNTCGSSVAPGGNCTISVTFTPTTTGRHGASVAITDNAAGSPQTVTLTGNAQRPLRPRLPHGFSISAPHSVRVEHRERP